MSRGPRFGAILRLYQEREDQAKAALGRLELARRPLEEVLEAIARERQQATQGPVLPALRDTLLAFCAAADRRRHEADERLKAHDALIAQARTAVAEAHRARTTIEKLRERDAEEARHRSERREQRMFDEFAARSHFQRLERQGT